MAATISILNPFMDFITQIISTRPHQMTVIQIAAIVNKPSAVKYKSIKKHPYITVAKTNYNLIFFAPVNDENKYYST